MPPAFKRFQRRHAVVFLALVVSSLTGCQSLPKPLPDAAAQAPHLYLIGDSTVADYPEDRYPLTGWGQALPAFFDEERITIVNAARSGRSSKSFYEEGAWTPIREALQPGDYVLIQFGHNDEKKQDPARFTVPETTYKAWLGKYLEETRARGAQPVLVTPIYRNKWDAAGCLEDTHAGYPEAMRALARAEKIPLLDLHALTGKRLEQLGPVASSALYMNLQAGAYPAYPEGRRDNSHLCEAGARDFCRMMVEAISTLEIGLEHYLK